MLFEKFQSFEEIWSEIDKNRDCRSLGENIKLFIKLFETVLFKGYFN